MARLRREMNTTAGNDESGKVLYMMLCVTTSFVVLLLPVSIYSLFVEDNFTITYAFLTALNTANCAINFYVYFLSGKLFRTEVKRLFKCFNSGTVMTPS